ncbi:receptor protein kinase 1-like [Trifolium medium]|uniref:Receptor protein kinase 1-like n=1 Tax=Trifolium medium TaxID=97028 RepID=A0A392NJ04_9FABA|nr:receptor protein kinase 1-like [Trifolium medium]
MFSAGFTAIGENAYSFAIWFTEQNSVNNTIVWMANRDQPVNGKRSKLTLLNTGNIVLFDVSLNNVWSSNTASLEPIELHLKDDGNLVLRELQGTNILWQSFDSPTDTLLPGQPLTRYTELVASRSESNYSTGFYKFSFDDSNVLVLRYDGPDISSSYWPKPWLLISQTGRASFNGSRIAILDYFGNFLSSDNLTFITSDYGTVLQRRMKMDPDGNLMGFVEIIVHVDIILSMEESVLVFQGIE